MEFSKVFHVLVVNLLLFLVSTTKGQQLSASETTAMFQIQKLLEYPPVLQGWNNWTNFCYLPSSSTFQIVCSADTRHIIELNIVGGNTSSPLSDKFSIDSLFTTLTKLSSLKVLSLVSLGLWGPLPAKINRFSSLEVLNVSSSFIYGEIPLSLGSMKSLKSLVLADNLFNGSVPDLSSLILLQELNLGGNKLGGDSKFPSLSRNVASVILRNNSFRSQIPNGLKNFNNLEQLDISYNKFLGPVPAFLFSLPSIWYLNLASNQLNGALPKSVSCSSKLSYVDISHNLLIGKLPSCIEIKSTSVNQTVNATWNCLSSGNSKTQFPYSHCRKEALAVKPPVVTKSREKSGSKLGLVLGVIGGVVCILVIIALLVLMIIRKGSKGFNNDETFDVRSVASKISARSSQKPLTEPRRVPQRMRSATVGLPPYRVFTLEEIEDATNNFDPMNFIGEENKSQVYKAWIQDGSIVIVKCVKVKQKNLSHSILQQHMDVLKTLRHRHVVSVLGHCIATYQDHSHTAGTVFIVLEHVSNGSFRDYLTDSRKKEMLKWPQRMAITIGAARGIQFLHTGVAPGIFGNNVKIGNILLDETLTAKLSGYTIPLPSKMDPGSPVAGNNPDEEAEKEDIYQLGVILLQVITGKIVSTPEELEEIKLELERGLAEGPPKLSSIIDNSVRGSYAYDSLRTTVEITVNCLAQDLSQRPSIEDVLWNLEYSIQVQEGWTSSGNLGTPS